MCLGVPGYLQWNSAVSSGAKTLGADSQELCLRVKYGVEQERSRLEWSGITPEWMGFDNKLGITLASAHALCLDLLSHVWLRISGGLNFY